jgi:hypothetical protein
LGCRKSTIAVLEPNKVPNTSNSPSSNFQAMEVVDLLLCTKVQFHHQKEQCLVPPNLKKLRKNMHWLINSIIDFQWRLICVIKVYAKFNLIVTWRREGGALQAAIGEIYFLMGLDSLTFNTVFNPDMCKNIFTK